MTEEVGLPGLFVYSLLAATLLPGGSEVALLVFAAAQPEALLAGWCVATLGNTLGGLTSVAIGRLLPGAEARLTGLSECWRQRLVEHGALCLLLAWLPLVGDLLCVAAGWLRLPLAASTFWLLVGKGARYGGMLWLWGAWF